MDRVDRGALRALIPEHERDSRLGEPGIPLFLGAPSGRIERFDPNPTMAVAVPACPEERSIGHLCGDGKWGCRKSPLSLLKCGGQFAE